MIVLACLKGLPFASQAFTTPECVPLDTVNAVPT